MSKRMTEKLVAAAGLTGIYDKVLAGERLNAGDGLALYENPNLNAVGALANIVRERMNGDKTYYVRNQHINYTNVCNKGCKFCAFYAQKGGPDPYTMSIEDVQNRLRAHLDIPIKEVHMVAGINPKLPYQYYLDLLRGVKAIRPGVHIKAFTCVEIAEIQRQANKPLPEVFAELKEAGLDSLPGGGIEILSDRVHHGAVRAQIIRRPVDRHFQSRRRGRAAAVRDHAVRPYRDDPGACGASGQDARTARRDRAFRDLHAAVVPP